MTLRISSFALFVEAAHILLALAVGSGDISVPIVRRVSNEAVHSTDRSQHAEIDGHGHMVYRSASEHHAQDVETSILRKAESLANDPSMEVHLSAEDRERLQIHPDMQLPRRDSLLQARAAIIRQKKSDANLSSKEPMPAISLLQEASVKRHTGGMDISHVAQPPSTHKISDAPSSSRFELPEETRPTVDGVPVPTWVPKNAFAEDGSLIMDRVLFSAPYSKRKRPEWVYAGSAHKDSPAAAFETEMTRLGREDELEDSLAAMEMDADERQPDYDPHQDKNAFRFYKFTPVKLRSIAHADMVQVAEFRLFSYNYELPLHQATVAWNEMGKNPAGHTAMMARDHNWQTTWQDKHMGSILLTFGGPVAVTNFMFITSMDTPSDDPVQWLFEGSNDPQKGPWKMLHAQLSDGNVPPQRTSQTEMFSWKMDCSISDWHEWSECSENCSGGNRTRIRKIMKHSWNNGHCDHEFDQVGYCNEEPCEKVIVKSGAPGGLGSDGILSLVIVCLFAMLSSQIVDV